MQTHSRRNFLGHLGGAALLLGPSASAAGVDELLSISAAALARRIREKKVSATEAVRASIARIEAVNPKLNAVVHTCFERAIQEAKEADAMMAEGRAKGPLHGVPMTIKDSLDTEGVVTTGGTVGRLHYVPKQDATSVARLRKAGAILLGKTNTPEFTLAGGGIPGVNAAANIIYGISRNPYDQTRTTSGSSGGAGAIVAAAGVPFDIGTDWGGSIRGPAHANGIAGIKPTTGRVPRTGHIVDYGGVYDSWQQVGPLARRVEDLTLILPIIAGPDFRDAAIAPVPWADPAKVEVSKLRVAFYPDNRVADTSDDTKAVVKRCARFLEEAGCKVQEDLPKDLMMEMEEIRFKLTSADGWTFVRRMADKWGTKAMSPVLVERMRAEPASTAEFTELLERQDDSRRKLLQWVKNYDVILCPAAGKPAEPINLGDDPGRRNPGKSYTGLYNSTGWPAAVVRGGTSAEGLPIGIQVVGRPWREDVVLAVCAHLEERTGGWKMPPV